MTKTTIVSQKIIARYKAFQVTRDIIQLSSNKKITHYNAQRNPVVAIFPLTASHEIYFVSQHRYLLQKQSLEAVAGFIEPDETSLKAAQRELQEEAGIIANQWEQLGKIEATASVFRSPAYLFLAKDLEIGEPNPDEDEDLQIVKLSLPEALHKITTGEINTSLTMIGIFLIDKLKREKKL